MKLISKIIHHVNFDFCLIEDSVALAEFAQLVSEGDILALDTEFTRRNTYYPILSTIQIALKKPANKKIVVLIDVLKCGDISAIVAIINNPKIIKVFHSSIQDLQIFFKISQQYPQNICDTQIMANFCQELANIGYSNLVNKIFAIEICKKMQNSDWQRRPLSDSQINYALIDVIFLHEIYQYFIDFLAQNNRQNWFYEEMENYIKKTLGDNSKNLINAFNLSKKDRLEVVRINKLALLREKYAQIHDLPREHFLTNIDLEFIAQNFPNVDFSKQKLPQNFINEAKQILVSHDSFYEVEAPQILDEEDKNNISKIKSLVAKMAKKYNINEQFLLNNNQMKNIVKARDVERVKLLINRWRYSILGNQIENILSKKI